jgi:hypothetical protein
MEAKDDKPKPQRGDELEHANERTHVVPFQTIDIIMMSLLILLLASTNALKVNLPPEIQGLLKKPGVNFLINVAFIFFTIVWSRGKANVSPLESTMLSVALFFIFMVVTHLPKAYFLIVMLLLILYFVVHHMQVYAIEADATPDKTQTWWDVVFERFSFKLSHQVHDVLMDIIFYTTLLVTVVGMSHKFVTTRRHMPKADRSWIHVLRTIFLD